MSTERRPASINLRQGLGIVLIMYGCLQLLGVVVLIFIIPIQIMAGNINYGGWPQLIGTGIGVMIMLVFVSVVIVLGIYLLRDKNGMYIKFLKN